MPQPTAAEWGLLFSRASVSRTPEKGGGGEVGSIPNGWMADPPILTNGEKHVRGQGWFFSGTAARVASRMKK